MSDDHIREQSSPAGGVALSGWRLRPRLGGAGMPPTAMGSRVAWIVIGVGLAVIGGYYYAGDDGQNAVYALFDVSATLAACVAAWRSEGRSQLIWSLFAAGLAAMVVADTLLDYELTGLTWPDWPDYAYLLSTVPLTGGVILLAWGLASVDRAAAAVDAAIVTGAIVLVEWVFVAAPIVNRHDNTMGGELVLLVYCVADLFMLITLSRFAVRGMRLGASHWLVAGGILAWTIADEAAVLSPALAFDASWADVFWLLGYVLWIAAALVPSAVDLGRVVERGAPELSLWRVSPVAPALLTVPVVLGVEASMDQPDHLTALVIGASVLAALVVVRVFGLLNTAERARRDLAERNRRLEELDELRDTLLASVSHDLRTPLTSILGNAELALEYESHGRVDQPRKSLEVIVRNGRRLAELVDDLLFVATASVGRLELAVEPVDVAAVARAHVGALREEAAWRGVELTIDVESRSTIVLADPRRIGQLLDNVLDNAVKFTPAGRVHVHLGGDSHDLVLEVTDTGPGVEPGETSRVFEPFYRGVAARARSVGGSGLGLHIAKAIVDAHGGTIELRNEPGAGTTCCVVLPLAPCALEVPA